MSRTRTTTVPCLLALALAAGSVAAQHNPPDSFADVPGARGTHFRVPAPTGAVVSVFPTNNGARITNGDGSEVSYAATSLPPANRPMFSIPGIINGSPVTDHDPVTSIVGAPPVDSRLSVFNSGVMIAETLGTWLEGQGFIDDTRLVLPFFTSTTGESICAGIDLNGMGNMGQMFADGATPGQVFTIGPDARVEGLGCIVFFTARPEYTVGAGWTGPLALEGTSVTYLGVGDIAATPTPGAAALLALGALAAARRRRA